MKPISIIGVLLIVAGVAALVLGEVSFTKRETVVQIGDAKLDAETKNTYPIPAIAGSYRRNAPIPSGPPC